MEKIVIDDINYEIIKNYKNGYNKDEFINKCTDYFNEYDFFNCEYSYLYSIMYPLSGKYCCLLLYFRKK